MFRSRPASQPTLAASKRGSHREDSIEFREGPAPSATVRERSVRRPSALRGVTTTVKPEVSLEASLPEVWHIPTTTTPGSVVLPRLLEVLLSTQLRCRVETGVSVSLFAKAQRSVTLPKVPEGASI